MVAALESARIPVQARRARPPGAHARGGARCSGDSVLAPRTHRHRAALFVGPGRLRAHASGTVPYWAARQPMLIARKGSMKVLVTGAAGRLGSALCAHLVEAGHEVKATDYKHREGLKVKLVHADLRDEIAVYS